MRFIFIFLFFPILLTAQSIERSALGSFAVQASGDFGSVQVGVGEVVVPSNAENGTSSGMEQPKPKLKVEVEKQARACSVGGLVFLDVQEQGECVQNLQVLLDGETVDPALLQLEAGEYSLQITADFYCPFETNLTVQASDLNTNCQLQFFNTVTPNGAFENSRWIIENIDLDAFRDNKVVIYNRWGQKVWSGVGYDNTSVFFAGESSSGQPLSDATYYYLVQVGEEQYQGYLELLR